MKNKVRVRFAPSPTGYLHIGGLRTVLFNYLIAKSLGGELILRIEDTDQKRLVPEAVEKLIEIIKWTGIEFDEGPGIGGKNEPYTQSQRLNIYKKYSNELIEKEKAYYCFCSPEKLAKTREEQQAKKEAPRYNRCCRDLSSEEVKKKIANGEKFVIRQKMPKAGEVIVNDELRGEIKFRAEDLEDHVLIKSDDIPTYHFASVVDDHLMEISHVVRGEEWIPSFPKNILLYQDFDWESPKFIHLPLVLNKDGGKLSKRQGDVAVEDFREKGYLSEALLNFVVLLGWHPKGDREIMNLKEIIKLFKIEDIGTSPAIFDTEKLDFLNGAYIREKKINDLVELVSPYLKENLSLAKKEEKKTDEFIKKVVALEQERLKKLSEIGEATKFFFLEELDYESDLLVWKKLTKDEIKNNLEKLVDFFGKISEKDWTSKKLEEKTIKHLKENDLKAGDFLWPMRVALTGRKASPGPFEVADCLEKEESLKKIKEAINKLT